MTQLHGHGMDMDNLHGQFIRQTTGKASEDWGEYLRKGCLKNN